MCGITHVLANLFEDQIKCLHAQCAQHEGYEEGDQGFDGSPVRNFWILSGIEFIKSFSLSIL